MSITRRLAIVGGAAGTAVGLGGAARAGPTGGGAPSPDAPAGYRYRDIKLVFYGESGEVLHRADLGHAVTGIHNWYHHTWSVPYDIRARTDARKVPVLEGWSQGRLLMRHVQDIDLWPHGDIHVTWDIDCRELLPIADWPAGVPQGAPFAAAVAGEGR